jgi:DNA helicase HerA-like ATPase
VYVLRLNVASSGPVRPLLSEVVASTLLGPVRQIGGGSLGGYSIVTPQTDAEEEIARRNLSLLDVEGWVYSAAPERVARIRHLAGEQETAIVFRMPLPGPEGVPGVARLDVKPVAPPSQMPVNGVVLGNSVTRGHDGPIRIRQNLADRRRHMYLVGKTGVGKSTLMEIMVLQDIEAGRGVCLVDPHGDLVEAVLARIPPHRADDVVLFDPSDEA